MDSAQGSTQAAQGDRWIPSSCHQCYGNCSILAHVVDDVVVKIQGNPDSPVGGGRLCGRGVAGIMTLYDVNRVNVPLMRTNPEKGLNIDPKWKEITWDEALDIIAEKLKKVREKDPRAFFRQFTTTMSPTSAQLGHLFSAAFGSPNGWAAGGGLHCGNGAHLMNGLMHASWSLVPDFDYCNYALYFGASKGHAAGHSACPNMTKAASARNRGMKLVVVDPMCNFAAAKATEWVPIRVGTDGALALGIANVLLNELGIYDANYIKKHTNGPYLIGPDGYYLRDRETGKPLVWDLGEGRAKTYDSPVEDYALEGEFEVEGVKGHPGFQLLKEHVRKYTPEEVSRITTIPAQTVRRLAREFGEAARIGSTIVLDGKELPYRPAAAIFFRGSGGHRNATYNCLAIDLLNHIVGSADLVGGALGFNPCGYGYPDTGRPRHVPYEGPDGLMVTGTWMGSGLIHPPYPPTDPRPPQTMMLSELFPLGMMSPTMVSSDQEEIWQKFNLPYRPEVMMNVGANSVMSVGNKETVAESLKRIPFIFSVDILLNEFSNFADIILPDACYLERLDAGTVVPIFNHPAGMGEWAWVMRQPAVKPQHSRRSLSEICLELAKRVGILEDLMAMLNVIWKLEPPYRLDTSQEYAWEELCDRQLKNNFGAERGLEWFKEHGLIKWPKQAEEVYWRHFLPVRVPIYFEFIKSIGEKAKKIAQDFDFEFDFDRYQAVPDWYPCLSHEEKAPELDLYAFYFRDTLHTNSMTMENPWLDEASQMNPYSYNITLHRETAEKKGIKDGDLIALESATGRRVQGRARLSEGIHPEGVAIGACAGHWSPYMPVAQGKGVFFNELLEVDLKHADPLSLNLDLCVKVKVSKV